MNVRFDSASRPTLRPLPTPLATPSPEQKPAASASSSALRLAMNQDRFEASPASALTAQSRHPMTATKFLGNVNKLHSPKAVYPWASRNGEKDLGEKKQDFFNRALKQGASKQEAAVIVAQLMQEGGRDESKDNQGLSANYGLLNLNGDLLTRFGGVKSSELKGLNRDAAGVSQGERGAARNRLIKAALTAMRHPQMGVERYLHHVRGGDTGYRLPGQRPQTNNPKVTQDDAHRFARNIKNSAKELLSHYNQNSNTMRSNTRFAGDIPWI